MFRMGRVADGIGVVDTAWRTVDIFKRATTGRLDQEWQTVCRRRTIFDLEHMILAVAEVIEIVDRLGAGLVNDVAESCLAGIHGLGAAIVIGTGIPQRTSPARNSKRWLFVQPNAA